MRLAYRSDDLTPGFLADFKLAALCSQRHSLEDSPMFDSLDDQMKKDLDKEMGPKQRMLMWVAVAVATVLLCIGLYYGVRLVEG